MILPERVVGTSAEFMMSSGRADKFVQLITDEIKPMIDTTYRTKPKREVPGIAGSSFGGIMALHAALSRPDVFGKAGVLSPSVWWDGRVMIKHVDALPKKPNVKIWLDMGTEEGADGLKDAGDLSGALQKKGWVLGRDLAYFIDKGAQHNEDAWAKRGPALLMFLFR